MSRRGCGPCYRKDKAKVTSKLEVIVPKAIAEQYGIRPGDEIEWSPAGDAIRVVPSGRADSMLDREARVKLFDAAAERQRRRQAGRIRRRTPRTRGWTREGLYRRGRAG